MLVYLFTPLALVATDILDNWIGAYQVRCVVVYSEALQETKEKDVDMQDEQVNNLQHDGHTTL